MLTIYASYRYILKVKWQKEERGEEASMLSKILQNDITKFTGESKNFM